MAAPVLTAADYLSALQALMPRGRVWPRESDSIQARFLATLTPSYERHHARSNALIEDGFPATTLELLPEWEATLGLPDPCAGAQPTLQLRRAQVVARFIGDGGQSKPYFIAVAAALGYAITITEFAPFRVGRSRAGDALRGEAWAHAWQVNAPEETVRYFATGVSAAGEPLAAWGNTVLECELRKLAPAHTTIIFAYGG